MRALRKVRPEAGLVLEQIPVPQIGPSDVLIRVEKAGICGTDQHIYGWDGWARTRIHPPLTVGHEFMGTVTAVGSSVHALKVGQRVSGEGHIADGTCYFCRTGDAHICKAVSIIGVDRDGAFADYIAMPQGNVWKLDPGVPDVFAAIFDPLGNAVHTVMAAGVSAKSVLIMGVGSIGLMAISVARAAGATAVYAVDVNPARLRLAKALGADEAFAANDPGLSQAILAHTDGNGVDVLLEMSGNVKAIDDGLRMVRNGGCAALLGLPAGEVSLNIADRIIFKGLTVLGINGRRMFETWYQAQAFVRSGKVDLHPIVTDVVPFEEFERAFALAAGGEAIKVVLDLTA